MQHLLNFPSKQSSRNHVSCWTLDAKVAVYIFSALWAGTAHQHHGYLHALEGRPYFEDCFGWDPLFSTLYTLCTIGVWFLKELNNLKEFHDYRPHSDRIRVSEQGSQGCCLERSILRSLHWWLSPRNTGAPGMDLFRETVLTTSL